MSNVPRNSPGSPRGRGSKPKKAPLISITCIIDSILQLRGDKSIVLFTGHDDGDEGNKHQITLYGNIDVTPDPKKFSIVGNLTTFQARLVTTSISGDGKETERVANIESYTGYVDKQGNFHR